MDPFLQYLIVINVVAFLAFAIDFFLCVRNPALDDSAANSLFLDIFPIAGGAVGALVALFIFTGLISKHRMNKSNIAWWFLAIVCLVVWSLIAAVRFGLITLDASAAGVFAGWDMGRIKILGIYLVAINVVTFIVFARDKHVASNGNDFRKRIPEARLLGLCLIGGSVGGLIAVHVFQHKTKKWYFVWGLPIFIVLNIAMVVYAHTAEIL